MNKDANEISLLAYVITESHVYTVPYLMSLILVHCYITCLLFVFDRIVKCTIRYSPIKNSGTKFTITEERQTKRFSNSVAMSFIKSTNYRKLSKLKSHSV